MYCLRCGYKNEEHAIRCKNCNSNIKEIQDRYDIATNSCEDQQDYRYKYSYGTNPPKTKTNTCEDQLDYRYRYSYGTNPPTTNQNTSDYQYDYSKNYLYTNTETTNDYSDITNDLIAGDEKYFQAYIGATFRYIIKQKFSITTLLFGPFYFLTKKMYAYSLLWFFALATIGYYQPNLLKISYFLINLFIATKFKKIYISFVDKQIEKIKLQSLDLTTDEIIQKCKQKGSLNTTNINKPKQNKNSKAAIIFFIIFILFATIPTIIDTMELFIEESSYPQFINNEKQLQYQVPQEFALVYKTDLRQEYLYSTISGQCTITIDKYININNYSNAEEFIKATKSIQQYTEYYTRLINNNIWTIIENNNITYYGIIINNNNSYIISFKIDYDYNQECQILINEFIHSLRIA